MEKFKYGPLVWNHRGEDDESGNYYWNGKPPVEYDGSKIPVDEDGNQCLPIVSPVHPGWQADLDRCSYNSVLGEKIPDLDYVSEWFEDNFLIVSDKQCKKYVLNWIRRTYRSSILYQKLIFKCSSIQEVMDLIWPQDEQKL